MNCYLCNSTSFSNRKGQVRDAPHLKIIECADCGLVTLSSLEHIQAGFYEQSSMRDADPVALEIYGSDLTPVEVWLKDNDWDDQRRFDSLKLLITNKRILDFGCGAGGFLRKAQQFASVADGVELERRMREYWQGKITIFPDVKVVEGGYDLITAFHVFEHLPDPIAMLKPLALKLSKHGRIVLEVPSSEDALLTLFDSGPFQRFSYWSPHLFLYNAETLRRLAKQAGLRIVSIQQYQRYPLSNHLHWLSHGKPGGHLKWAFLDSPELKAAYGNALAAVAKCDTLIAHLEPVD